MLYQDRYFKQDKNSILRAAQGFVEPQLVRRWVDVALDTYMQLENPMGLVDDFILELRAVEKYDTSFLQELYDILAAIYRYRKGDNQLEIIWDGRSHYEVYAENWSEEFNQWILFLCKKPEVYRAIIKACILQQPVNHKFLFYNLRRTILVHFELRIGKNRFLKTA